MKTIDFDLMVSTAVIDSHVFPNEKVAQWIDNRRSSIKSQITQKSLKELKNWIFDEENGVIRHSTGGFFSINGVSVRTNWGKVAEWDQPIINQPEIGFLGFIAKKIDGVLHLLVQAKIEPGNINVVQLSPTLQATKSNYLRKHKGKAPKYLEYFNGEKTVKVLLDQLQSEQGARFLKKRNRNMIVEVDERACLNETSDNVWLTVGQIKELMRLDNVVNMDTRTVLSGINYGYSEPESLYKCFGAVESGSRAWFMQNSVMKPECSINDFREILSWITNLKSKYELCVEKKSLNALDGWHEHEGVIERNDKKYFRVIGVGVLIENREVLTWDQPMIQPSQQGLCAFIVKKINGVYHFLIQAKLEAGNFDVLELAPTVQCLTGNYRTGLNEYSVPYISEIINAPKESILYSAMQSEEGGRFYNEENLNAIVEVGDQFPMEVEESYCWMTLNQILRLIEFNNFLNISARSLISAISYI